MLNISTFGCFLHAIPVESEAAFELLPSKNICMLQEHTKKKCLLLLYQPFQCLSINKRMVKSKARCHLIQYIKNKPCKWGFKYWVLADSSGYIVDLMYMLEKVVKEATVKVDNRMV